MSHPSPRTATSNNHVNINDNGIGSTPQATASQAVVAESSTPTPRPPPTSTPQPQPVAGPSRLPHQQPDGHPSQSAATRTPNPIAVSQLEREATGRKRKWSSLGFNAEEQESMERTTTAYHYALAQDQLSTLFPEPPTAFTSYDDMVGRLVPYHIWQTCDEELEGYEGGDQGKRKAKEEKEGKEASEVLTRMTKINQRFMKLRTLDAKKPSPTVDLIYMIKESTAVLREELSSVQARLRSATAEQHALEWEERARLQKIRQAEIQSREAEERRVAALVAANTKHGQSSTPVAAPTQAPAAPSRPSVLSTPAPTSARATPSLPKTEAAHTPLFEPRPGRVKHVQAPAPTTTPTPALAPVPSTSSQPAPAQPTPTRGRGRPRKSQDPASTTGASSGKGSSVKSEPKAEEKPATTTSSSNIDVGSNLAELPLLKPITQSSRTVVSQSASPANTPPIPASSLPATPSSGSRATRAHPAPAPVSAPVPASENGPLTGDAKLGPMKGPVSITVPIASVPDLLRAEVLTRDSDSVSRAPATIARKAEDKKSVVLSIDLSRCNPKQLVALAKILKVDTATNAGAGDAVAQVAEGG